MPQNFSRLDWLSVVLAASFPALLYVVSQASNQGFNTNVIDYFDHCWARRRVVCHALMASTQTVTTNETF
jgi:ABC-type anion transport system duplicated permease subunit